MIEEEKQERAGTFKFKWRLIVKTKTMLPYIPRLPPPMRMSNHHIHPSPPHLAPYNLRHRHTAMGPRMARRLYVRRVAASSQVVCYSRNGFIAAHVSEYIQLHGSLCGMNSSGGTLHVPHCLSTTQYDTLYRWTHARVHFT